MGLSSVSAVCRLEFLKLNYIKLNEIFLLAA